MMALLVANRIHGKHFQIANSQPCCLSNVRVVETTAQLKQVQVIWHRWFQNLLVFPKAELVGI
jgi:hypothetical protein